MKYPTLLLFGAPGSGKGTQGKIMGARPGYHHCACGDVFRALDSQSEMGKKFAEFSKTGALVPDEYTIELWRKTIEGRIARGEYNPATETLLLDGIPRTVDQAKLLDDKIDVTAIIYLVCNDIAEIISRLQHRARSSNRADDANEEVIRYRLEVYEEQTRPVLACYPPGKVLRINATQEPEKVSEQIIEAMARMKTP
jgi:adenylate kinase